MTAGTRPLLVGLGPSLACGRAHTLVLPLLDAAGRSGQEPSRTLPFAERVEVLGLLEAALERADATGLGVVTLWPHPPARASLLPLPDWAVSVVSPTLGEQPDLAAAFLGRNLVGKAAATFAARAVAVTEALRTSDLALLRFALEDGPLTDLTGARIPGLQPALLAAREAGVAAGLSRLGGMPCLVAIHPDATATEAAAAAMEERLAAHALASTRLLSRFDRPRSEP